jgi:hypothetical protein
MSTSISFGESQATVQVATNRGWIDVVDWADDQSNEAYPTLMTFIDHGQCDDIPAMIGEIDRVFTDDPPDDKTVAKTLRGLRVVCEQNKEAGYVIVSDGFESGYESAE